jgi:hypothetical protein
MQTDLDGAGKMKSSLGLSRETLFQPAFLAAKGLFSSFTFDVFNAKFQGFLLAPEILVMLKYIMKCFFVKEKYLFLICSSLALFSDS